MMSPPFHLVQFLLKDLRFKIGQLGRVQISHFWLEFACPCRPLSFHGEQGALQPGGRGSSQSDHGWSPTEGRPRGSRRHSSSTTPTWLSVDVATHGLGAV